MRWGPTTSAMVCMFAVVGCGGGDDSSRVPAVARAVPPGVCSPVIYGGEGAPRLVVPLVGPLQNAVSDHGIQNAQAVKLIMQQRGWRAGEHAVAVQICDESSAREYVDLKKCERAARAFAGNPSVVAVVGPTLSSCAAVMIPLLNDARPGAVALVGTGNTYLGLTRRGPGVADGHPERLYPSGRRSYFRTVAADDAQAAAAVLIARRAGARRVFAIHDGSDFGRGVAAAFMATAARIGLKRVGTSAWVASADGYRSLASRIRRAQPDAVYLGGAATSNGPRLVRDLRAVLGERVEILAPDGFNQPTAIVEGAGRRAEGLTVTLAALPVRALPDPGRRWAATFRRRWGASPCCYSVHAGQAMTMILDAIAGSDGTRAGVIGNLRRATVRGGLVGDFRFDRFGDTTLTSIATYRIRGGRLRYEESVDVPRALLTRR